MNKHNFAISTSLLLLGAVGLTACADQGDELEPPAQLQDRLFDDASLPAETYYSVRPDLRKCVSPICGGYFLSEVNKKKTTCADGTKVNSTDGCYVSEIDFNGLTLEEGGLIFGSFVKKEYPGFGTYDTFAVESLYNPLFDIPHRSWFRYNLVRDNGLRCITSPCPSTDISKLNTRYVWQDDFTFEDIEAFGGDEQAARAAFEPAYATEGSITDGFWYSPWYTGAGWELSITNVFVRNAPMCLTVRDAFDDSIVAWNVTTQAQADALIGDPAQWQWTDLTDGTCVMQAAVTLCPADYAPICGTIDVTMETQTYSNECVLTQAVRIAAGESGKATGTSTKGECGGEPECNVGNPDYTYVGNSPEECSLIKFTCPEGEDFFSDDCGCGCWDDPGEPNPGEPGSICGGFANAQCVGGLECVGLGDNGSSAGVCSCPEFINCFPGPDTPGCASNIQELCPDSEVVF